VKFGRNSATNSRRNLTWFSVDLRRRHQEERCEERGDIRAHFTKLRTMREELAAMGQTPTVEDLYAIILGSLPSSFDPYISAVSATSSMIGVPKHKHG
jgi:hypothetical protein